MKVKLSHVPNPDVRGGYWSDMHRDRALIKNATTLAHCVALCQKYIGRNDLGGGNWDGGQVFDDHGNQIARVSYNGRVWANDGSEIELH